MNFQVLRNLDRSATHSVMQSNPPSDNNSKSGGMTLLNKDDADSAMDLLITTAKEFDINLLVTVYDMPTTRTYAFGKEFNNRKYWTLSDRKIDFESLDDDRYYTSDLDDPSEQALPLYGLINSKAANIDHFGDNYIPIMEMHPINQLDENSFQDALFGPEIKFVFEGRQSSRFENRLSKKIPGLSFAFGESSQGGFELSPFNFKLFRDFAVLFSSMFILNYLIFQSQSKKISVLKMHGVGDIKLLLETFMPTWILTGILGFLFIFANMYLYRTLNKVLLYKVFIAYAFIGIQYLLSLLIQFTIFFNMVKKIEVVSQLKENQEASLAFTFNMLLKVLILLLFIIPLADDVSVYMDFSHQTQVIKNASKSLRNTFTLRNESVLDGTTPLIGIDYDKLKSIRNELNDLGGIYFDIKSMSYYEFIETGILNTNNMKSGSLDELKPVEHNIILVNKNYLNQYPLLDAKGQPIEVEFTPGTLLIPKSTVEQESYWICKSTCVVDQLNVNFKVQNINLNGLGYIQHFENVGVYMIEDDFSLRSNNRMGNSAMSVGSPFFEQMTFEKDQEKAVVEILKRYTPGYENIQIRHSQNFFDVRQGQLDKLLKMVLIDIYPIVILLVGLTIQSILAHFDIYKKKMAVLTLHGHHFYDVLKEFTWLQLIVYVLIMVYYLSGIYKKVDYGFQNIQRIHGTGFFLVQGVTMIFDLLILVIMNRYFTKNIIGFLKGDSYE